MARKEELDDKTNDSEADMQLARANPNYNRRTTRNYYELIHDVYFPQSVSFLTIFFHKVLLPPFHFS